MKKNNGLESLQGNISVACRTRQVGVLWEISLCQRDSASYLIYVACHPNMY